MALTAERQWLGIYQQLIDLERELGKPALSNHRWLRNVIEDVHSQFPMELGA
jgi:hypothetical protein